MSTATEDPKAQERRPGELNLRELLRWGWRQLTSMRTALVLLLLLALAAVPGSVIPQESVDSLGVTRWKEQHPDLTPVYERLDLFSVYDSAWFSAIYLLLMVSLVGCFVPRIAIYWKALRAQPPRAPRHLTRLPDHATYATDEGADEHLARARETLKRRGYRLRAEDTDVVSAERGYLREAGNLVFHVSVLIVLVGFAIGGLFGYKGGVILVEGSTFSNSLTQYDDFDPGSLFRAEQMEPFSFTVGEFDVDWLETSPGNWMAQSFNAGLSYRESPADDEGRYDLRVNHPLSIGDTEVFLIGHGYAPVVTVRDGNGDVAYSGPSVFLPQDASFLSFGVIKAPDAQPAQLGFEGLFYPSYVKIDGDPYTAMPDDKNPTLSMLVYSGDLGLDAGAPQSVYVLDKSNTEQVKQGDGKPFRVDIQPGQTVELPDGLGSIEFEGVQPWTRIQISQTPGKEVALAGVVLALIGLLGSLFIRPRRIWVRARREGEGTMVEVAALDRSGNGEMAEVLDEIVAELRRTENE
jgi:cytochrome c biogenesis protein